MHILIHKWCLLAEFTLAYVAFPEAVTKLPAAFVWSILFFLMLFTLAVDTVFFMCEAIVVALMDEFNQTLGKRRLWIIAALCITGYFLGLPMVTNVRDCRA
jgi:SNF family Na+-dependent transporter